MMPDRNLLHLLREISAGVEADRSLDALAARSGWSKFHVHRRFTAAVGETPKQYTLRLRLERAAALLAATSAPVLDIALAVGFSGHEVFTRAFRGRFGCSPSQYRTEALSAASQQERERHAALIHAVGPCIGLFNRSLHQPETNDMTAPVIERREVAAQPILFVRRRVPHTQLAALFGECFPRLYVHCQQAGFAMAGKPLARYVTAGPGLWTVDCAIPLLEPGADHEDLKAGELQAGPVAFAVHQGIYERLPETNAAIEQWIDEQGFERTGPSWEAYVTDPAEHPDPADWRTEVYWPIRG